MAIIKCKMCGGDIELSADKTFGTCEYCGCTMTLPKVDNDQRAAAFNRGNHFRRIGEFDKALAVYERIVAEDNTDAEAHWCCALCRFGIEYVEDPTTYEWLPTCHRASFDSILEDVDYLAAVEYSDGITRRQYQKDGAKIAEVQRAVLATSQKEEPFDVFICYKESDENGNRTVDSTLAQDIYYQLTDKGYRVFFSRITLEDKVGAEYEPYIFAALNSAKVMIVVGTKPEHFSAVWVKNEWSRFLALMRKDRSKLLLPCYRDVDPYDLPEQLSVLQSYDMAKIGFIQDLIRGVSKVLDADKEQPAVKETVIVQSEGGSNIAALLKRGQMALEDGEWEKADDFFEQVLNQNAECAGAYFGKFLAKVHFRNIEAFVADRSKRPVVSSQTFEACPEDMERINQIADKCYVPGYLEKSELVAMFTYDRSYQSELSNIQRHCDEVMSEWETDNLLVRSVRFATGEFANKLTQVKDEISRALTKLVEQAEKEDLEKTHSIKEEYASFLNKTEALIIERREFFLAEREKYYQRTCQLQEQNNDIQTLETAAKDFASNKLRNFKDSNNRVKQCQEKVERIRKENQERARIASKKAADKRNMVIGAVIAAIVACVGIYFLAINVIIPNGQYNKAMDLKESGDYEAAIHAFEEMDGYKDSTVQITECKYNMALALKESEQYEAAITAFNALSGYEDSTIQITDCKYEIAVLLKESKQYEAAITAFQALDGYKDSSEQIDACNAAIKKKRNADYKKAIALKKSGDYIAAIAAFEALGDFKDSPDQIKQTKLAYHKKIMLKAKVGDYVLFGTYEQDNNTSNGAEDIEWRVLKKEDNRILVISKYGLFTQSYHTKKQDVTWETCSLRKMLNDTFLKSAFTNEEQKMVPSVSVSTNENPHHGTNPGNSTTDQVFLLSSTEAEKYLSTDKMRECNLTEYAYEHLPAESKKRYSQSPFQEWWLRTPGYNSQYAMIMHGNGSINAFTFHGSTVDFEACAVRPAMWIDYGS